ncbi:MAG: aspartate/glutamate racemase family protein [Betaproteobacteria bacterium]|jgi:allantoin racemase|nr:aspartate/glutamate racemase family protein [Betaproteobacteria bacterium]
MKMKIWYQSMSRQTSWGHYNVALRRILDRVKDPQTTIEVHGITKRGGLADQFHYLDYLESGEVMENVQTATRRGFDAFLIGNIGDPGIHACREITTMPVLGLCETALHTACMMGRNFSLVTINEKFTPRIIDNVHRYKLERRLAAVNRMTIDRINDLDEGFTKAASRKRIFDQFMKAANANVDQGAEVIIAAGGVVMALLAEFGVHSAAKNTPILNGIVSLVKMGEAAVKMNRIMGGKFLSKRLYYAPPGVDQIDEIREHYGDVYPTVPAGRKTASRRDAKKPATRRR